MDHNYLKIIFFSDFFNLDTKTNWSKPGHELVGYQGALLLYFSYVRDLCWVPMLLTFQFCAQETDGLYDSMVKAVARSEVHCISLTLYLQIHMSVFV